MADESKESMTLENGPSVSVGQTSPQGRTFLERLEGLLARLKPGTTSPSEHLAEVQAKIRQESASKTPTSTGKST